MSGVAYDYMENYIKSLLPEVKGELSELRDYAMENSVPIIHDEVGQFIKVMLQIKKPLKILELGTAIGYSAILMCKNSLEDCKITTIERDPKMIEIASENLKKYGFDHRVNIVQGDCLDVLESMNEEFDFIFMDAGKGHYNHFLTHCIRMLKKDGIIVADNVLFRGMVASDELVKRRKITIVKRMRKFLDLVSKDDNLITSVIPMGDGIAVITRRNSNE